VNVTGTANLVTACLGAGVRRIVYISTESVYGDCISLPATEETPVNTDHVYEGNYPRSKLEGENLVMRAWRDHGLEVAVIRVCLIYGPGDSAGTRQIHQWAARRIHLLIDGGRSRISTVYVTDVADAIECAAENQRAVGRIYNVTDGAAVTKREIFEMIAEVTRKPKVYFPIPGRPLYALFYGLHAVLSPFISASSSLLDPRRILFSMAHHELESGRIRRELGYEPRVTLREGLRRVFADAPSLKSLYRTDRSGPEGTR
jgi:nucleoside-diphosphate-sugar epimerase